MLSLARINASVIGIHVHVDLDARCCGSVRSVLVCVGFPLSLIAFVVSASAGRFLHGVDLVKRMIGIRLLCIDAGGLIGALLTHGTATWSALISGYLVVVDAPAQQPGGGRGQLAKGAASWTRNCTAGPGVIATTGLAG